MTNASEVRTELLPIKKFAARLGISVWTARGWCDEGVAASVKIRRKILVPASEVDRLIAENLRPAVPQ